MQRLYRSHVFFWCDVSISFHSFFLNPGSGYLAGRSYGPMALRDGLTEDDQRRLDGRTGTDGQRTDDDGTDDGTAWRTEDDDGTDRTRRDGRTEDGRR